MTSMINKYNDNNAADFSQILDLISEQKFGKAINELKKIIEADKENLKARTLLEHLEKIVEYQNMDLFSSTNLNMDP
ncbi:MAG TPA: hypothetical protein ENN90_03790 [Mariniphaga anaerophila]|uniref:Uncharacterized protein n=1 Tax=Mariniphaga anaerophila TaxID=1484053 RepID=A0A831LJM3_9BACT|nr:hypothetical protein [Mariniphaga anaerophila]